MISVAVLFARADSVYKTIPGCDVWDIERDARRWPGGCSVVAHPPCRAWGRLRTFANPRKGERLLATWAVRQVRKWGSMTDIMKLAEQAGFLSDCDCANGIDADLQRFADLIRADEREACALVCESRATPGTGSVAILNGAADAIRARGTKEQT